MPDKVNAIQCPDLDAAIEHYVRELGYRLDMIVPADSPTMAMISKGGEQLRLSLHKPARKQGRHTEHDPPAVAFVDAPVEEWIKGRAGMEYRDLLPDRLGGRVIVSNIRLVHGGPIPDYVHYHKVDFQMIYCKRGRIKVVYEDQGPPFWLETGDCVLQPPEIRHRVLECTAGAEVIEIGIPAIHETWVEHEIDLPTGTILPDRDFGGQRFVRHIAAGAEWRFSESAGFETRDTGISAATFGMADVQVVRTSERQRRPVTFGTDGSIWIGVKLDGELSISVADAESRMLTDGAFVIQPTETFEMVGFGEFLLVKMNPMLVK